MVGFLKMRNISQNENFGLILIDSIYLIFNDLIQF